jgi:hypothetical protein
VVIRRRGNGATLLEARFGLGDNRGIMAIDWQVLKADFLIH